jgi:hypothetical protein
MLPGLWSRRIKPFSYDLTRVDIAETQEMLEAAFN